MRDEDISINGAALLDIFSAIELLQKAKLDTSSVTMSLSFAIPKDRDKEPIIRECWRRYD